MTKPLWLQKEEVRITSSIAKAQQEQLLKAAGLSKSLNLIKQIAQQNQRPVRRPPNGRG